MLDNNTIQLLHHSFEICHPKKRLEHIMKLYHDMNENIIKNESMNDIKIRVNNINHVCTLISTLLFTFEFKKQANHIIFLTSHVSHITSKQCASVGYKKICYECWKLSQKHFDSCKFVETDECNCLFHCCFIKN
jgi:hypothetical protein